MIAMNAVATLNARPLKKLEPAEMAVALHAIAVELNDPRIDTATLWATLAHMGQTRAARGQHEVTAYVEHPMRCAVRLHRLGVTDPEVIIAALLHDVVEDAAERIATLGGCLDAAYPLARAYALASITAEFSQRVATTVSKVTNVESSTTKKMDAAARRRIYVMHIEENVDTADALLIKIADFIDNAGSLHHTPMLRNIEAKAVKYLAVSDVLLRKIDILIEDENLAQTLTETIRKITGRLHTMTRPNTTEDDTTVN